MIGGRKPKILSRHSTREYRLADIDEDGQLSLDEFRALLEQQHGAHKIASDIVWASFVRASALLLASR